MCIRDRLLGCAAHRVLVVECALLASFSEVAAASEVHPVQLAYLDPGTGSLMIQALIAAFAGAAVVLRKHWKRIQRALGFPSAEVDEEETGRNPGSDE